MAFGALTAHGTAAFNKTSGTTITKAPTSTIAAGSLVVAMAVFDNSGSGTPSAAFSDSAGNTWTSHWVTEATSAGGGCGVAIGWSVLTTQLTTGSTVTLTLSAAVTAKVLQIASGTVDGGPLSVVGTNGGSYGTSGNPVAQHFGGGNAGDLVLALIGVEGTGAVPTGMPDTDTLDGAWAGNLSGATTGGSAATNVGMYGQYKIITGASIQRQDFNATNTADDWCSAIVRLREPPAGTPQSDSDSGAGTDDASLGTVTGSDSDSGSGTDTASAVANVSDSDSGTSTEDGLVGQLITDGDTGTGTDDATVAVSQADGDAGTGTDDGSITAVSGVDSDGGIGTDDGAVTASFSDSDSGTGTDASSLTANISDSDSGTGTDTASASTSVTDSDSGTGDDTRGPAEQTSPNTTPANFTSGAATLGMRFTADANGVVTHVRYYGASNALNRNVHVWSSGGVLLATAADPLTGFAGWRTVALPSAVAVTAGQTYTVSYSSGGQGWYFTSTAPPDIAPNLTVLGTYYAASNDTFPATVQPTTDFHVDVVFQPATGSGSVTAAPSDSDAATGADAATLETDMALSGSDTGTATDDGGMLPSSGDNADADAGAGTDAATLTVSASDTDAGTGTDTGAVTVTWTDADAGTGTDGATWTVTGVDSDTGTGADNGVVAVSFTGTDSGSGTDDATGYLLSTGTDTGTGTETGSVEDRGNGVVLDDASRIYIGAIRGTRAYLGTVQVWP